MLLVGVQLAEQINLHLAFALLVGQLCQLDHQHQAEKRQLLVLVVENQQRQKVFLKEVPAAQFCSHKWLFLTVEF